MMEAVTAGRKRRGEGDRERSDDDRPMRPSGGTATKGVANLEGGHHGGDGDGGRSRGGGGGKKWTKAKLEDMVQKVVGRMKKGRRRKRKRKRKGKGNGIEGNGEKEDG
jgi:hypothetical protein